MTVSLRRWLIALIAVVTAISIVGGGAIEPISPRPVAAAAPVPVMNRAFASVLLAAATTTSPTLLDEIKRGIIPSLGAALPTPPPPASVSSSNLNQGIKNLYNTVEPWVRYGFELATYAVGWIPWVGWLAPQIMIFYNFGERIVRSITFNLDDWILGPLPFFQGLKNVINDSWNALLQLGRDQWNFWLPPLPPLPPLAAKQTKTAAVAATATIASTTDGTSSATSDSPQKSTDSRKPTKRPTAATAALPTTTTRKAAAPVPVAATDSPAATGTQPSPTPSTTGQSRKGSHAAAGATTDSATDTQKASGTAGSKDGSRRPGPNRHAAA